MLDSSIYENLTISEKKCYNAIENLGPELKTYSITKFCNENFVSTATVNRLIKKLGFTNFKNFKESLEYYPIELNSVATIINFFIEKIPNLMVEQIANKINNTQKIYIVSFGLSSSIGAEFSNNLNILGFNSISILEDEILFSALNHCKKNDVIIYISQMGNDINMLITAEKYKNNFHQILISCNKEAKLSHHVNESLIIDDNLLNHNINTRVFLNILTLHILCSIDF